MEHSHINRDSWYGGIISFLVSFVHALYTHIDWWAVLQSVICAVIGFFVVRFLSKKFPQK
jgi:phosphotransferase system  glucose/maltose/N-acetylglucosamine-specific IIC component